MYFFFIIQNTDGIFPWLNHFPPIKKFKLFLSNIKCIPWKSFGVYILILYSLNLSMTITFLQVEEIKGRNPNKPSWVKWYPTKKK